MIQRIQSVYLLIASIFLIVSLFVTSAILTDATQVLEFKAMGIYNADNALVFHTWGVICIGALSALFAFFAIFMFKKRMTQIKFSYASIIFVLLYYLTFFVYASTGMDKLGAVFGRPHIGLILPAISVIFILLAIKRIKADEKLVKSLNRIR